MVTPRRPDETDADYVARIGDIDRRWEIAVAQADRAIREMLMVAELGRMSGFDAVDLDGWQKRSALLRGANVATTMADFALGAGSTAAALHPREFLEAIPDELGAALDTLGTFNATEYDAMIAIPQSDIDAVAAAADVVAEQLKPALEALKGN